MQIPAKHPMPPVTGNAIPTAISSADLRHDQIVKQAEIWVAQTFFGRMLKQMRDSPFKSDLFDGGRGGQAFNEMHDGLLAQRMTRGVGGRLVDPIVRRLEANRAYGRTRSPENPQRLDRRPAAPGASRDTAQPTPDAAAETQPRAREPQGLARAA